MSSWARGLYAGAVHRFRHESEPHVQAPATWAAADTSADTADPGEPSAPGVRVPSSTQSLPAATSALEGGARAESPVRVPLSEGGAPTVPHPTP